MWSVVIIVFFFAGSPPSFAKAMEGKKPEVRSDDKSSLFFGDEQGKEALEVP